MEVKSVSFPRNIEDEGSRSQSFRERERERGGRRNIPFSCLTYIYKGYFTRTLSKVCIFKYMYIMVFKDYANFAIINLRIA